MIAFRINEDVARDLRVYAAARGESIQDVAERAIAAAVRQRVRRDKKANRR